MKEYVLLSSGVEVEAQQVTDFLEQQGCEYEVCNDLAQLVADYRPSGAHGLIIRSDKVPALTEADLEILAGRPIVRTCPVMLLAPMASEQGERLRQVFDVVWTVDLAPGMNPCADIERFLIGTEALPAFEPLAEQSLAAKRLDTLDFDFLRSSEADQQLRKLGNDFTRTAPRDLRPELYMPSDARAADLSQQAFSRLDIAHQGQMLKTIQPVDSLASVLPLSSEEHAAVCTAGFLYTWAFEGEKELLSLDYCNSENRYVRQAVCTKLRESSELIAGELDLPDVAQIVAKIGEQLDDADTEANPSVTGSLLLSSDFAARSCWLKGRWNPRGVRKILRAVDTGSLPRLHPAVAAVFFPSMIEGILQRSNPAFAGVKASRSASSGKASEQKLKQGHRKEQESVSIALLAPGMVLAEALVAADGQQILEEGTKLDRDLIWRAWRLAAVHRLCPGGEIVVCRG